MLLGWQRYKDGRQIGSGDVLDDALAARHTGDFVWIRVTEPHAGEIQQLAEEFGLPELAVEDAVQAHQRPKLERYDDTLFAVLKPAIYDDDSESITLGEVHVFSGPDYCITVRHGVVGTLDDVCRRLDDSPELTALGAAAVLYAVADQIVDAYTPVIAGLEYDITEIEGRSLNLRSSRRPNGSMP